MLLLLLLLMYAIARGGPRRGVSRAGRAAPGEIGFADHLPGEVSIAHGTAR